MASAASSSSTILTTTLPTASLYNFGPITSLFVPPKTCSQTLTSGTLGGRMYLGHNGSNNFDPACYPLGSVGAPVLESTISWGIYYYSPAICPSGFTTAVTFTSTFPGFNPSSSDGPPSAALKLGSQTSAALCCPSNFDYNGNGHECISTASAGETFTYFLPTQAGLSQARGTPSTTALQSTSLVFGDGVPIWWQATDSAVLSAASKITGSPTTSPTNTHTHTPTNATPTNTNTPTSSPSPLPTPSSSGLSTGAKVAIGVVIPLVFIAILAGLFWFFRSRRRRQVAAENGDGHAPQIAEIGEGRQKYELANTATLAEMYSDALKREPLSP